MPKGKKNGEKFTEFVGIKLSKKTMRLLSSIAEAKEQEMSPLIRQIINDWLADEGYVIPPISKIKGVKKLPTQLIQFPQGRGFEIEVPVKEEG